MDPMDSTVPAGATTTGEMAPRVSSLTVAGCTVRVMRKGTGAPLLFLHGIVDAGVWLPIMDRLAEVCEVIVPDHPGFGQSDTPAWLDSTGDLAYFYLDFLHALGLGPVHVVGHCLGGWIAAEVAVRDPAAFRTMTLSAPAGISVKGVRKGDLFLWSPQETLRQMFHAPEASGLMPVPEAAEHDPLIVQLQNRETTARLGWNPRLHNPDLRKWLHRARVPTLILWGADDRLLPAAYGAAWRDLIPGAVLEVLPDCGHLPHVEQAEAFARLALPFIGQAA